MANKTGPSPKPLQEPAAWSYDFNPSTGISRAQYPGEVDFGGGAPGVASFNGRTGAVVLTTADVTGAGGAPTASPALTGSPTAPTAAPGSATSQIANTAFVAAALAANALAVSSQSFLASGTYTPPAGLVYAIVEAQGAGGAGGFVTGAASVFGGG